jgi:hypothetical protein
MKRVQLSSDFFDGHVSLLEPSPFESLSSEGHWYKPLRGKKDDFLNNTIDPLLAGELSVPSGVKFCARTNSPVIKLTCSRDFGQHPALDGYFKTGTADHFTFYVAEAIYNIVSELKFDCYVNGKFCSSETVPSRIKRIEGGSSRRVRKDDGGHWKDMATRIMQDRGDFTEDKLGPVKFEVLFGPFSQQSTGGNVDEHNFSKMNLLYPTGTDEADDTNMHHVCIWLPHTGSIKIHSAEIQQNVGGIPGRMVPLLSQQYLPRRWIVYGSSITQAAQAKGPSETWVGTASRLFGDARLLSLGVSGQCHLDQTMARVIRDEDCCDFVALELGINVYIDRSMSIRTFRSNVLGFILTIRDGHPRVPILVISPIAVAQKILDQYDRPMGTRANAATLSQFRGVLKTIVANLNAAGDNEVYYRSGLDLISQEEAEMSALMQPDGIHPTGHGQEIIGQRVVALEEGNSLQTTCQSKETKFKRARMSSKL